MLAHALAIVINELETHLALYGQSPPQAGLGNLSEGVGTVAGNVPRDRLNFSVVNIKEEKALKNVAHYVRNDVRQVAMYENPPVFLNFLVLVAATHGNYSEALKMLSRVIRFFQSKNVFTQDDVAPNSMITTPPTDPRDELESFKLIFDLYSPTMEEVNHLWGILGGKQYPFVLYVMRMLDLKFKVVQSESGLITEVVNDFHHKNSAVRDNG
jgi:hypothetical protein